MKTKPSAKAICGIIFASIFMFLTLFCFLGSWIKVDSLESKHEIQHIFTNLKEKAELVAEYQKTNEDINLDALIDGFGDIPIKRFTKVMTRMNAAIDNQGISPTEMIYPFAINLIGPLDTLSKVNTYSVSQRQGFYEIECFVIAIVIALLLTLIVDLFALLLKLFGKTGFFNVVSAIFHFVLVVMMLIMTLGLTGFMENRYSDVVFTITWRPVAAFVCAFLSAVFAVNLRDKKVKKSKKSSAVEVEPVAEELTELPTVESELEKQNK